MKLMIRPASFVFALTLLLSACGGGGGGGGSNPGGGNTGDLNVGGAGLSLNEFVDATGAPVSVNFSSAVDINNANEVVGYVEASPGQPFAAGLWTVNATGAATAAPTALSALAGNTFSAAFAIDEDGNAVGQSAKGAQRVAVRWPFASGAPEELPALAAGGNSTAFNVSGDGGLIVGEAQDASGRTRAVIWMADAQGTFSAPPSVLPVNIFAVDQVLSTFSSAGGVARVGSEIWVAGEALDGTGRLHAALWRSADQTTFSATDLADTAEIESAAYAVNANGLIVGEAEVPAGLVPVQWSADGQGGFQRTSLAAAGSAAAVNLDNRTAGWSGTPSTATVWDLTVGEMLFATESWAYNLNDALQPLVVGRNGSYGFIKRVD